MRRMELFMRLEPCGRRCPVRIVRHALCGVWCSRGSHVYHLRCVRRTRIVHMFPHGALPAQAARVRGAIRVVCAGGACGCVMGWRAGGCGGGCMGHGMCFVGTSCYVTGARVVRIVCGPQGDRMEFGHVDRVGRVGRVGRAGHRVLGSVLGAWDGVGCSGCVGRDGCVR